MRFLMLVCSDTEPVPTPSTPTGDVEEWVEKMDSRGLRVTGDAIEGSSATKVVRVRDGELLVTDGPFVETKEVIAGFDVLECRDMAEAIEVAAAHPFAAQGVMEIRPVREL
jgi:hypothetical protein